MGFSSDAHCFACGYDTVLLLGANRAIHRTYAAWPVSCESCAAVTTANFKEKPLTCAKCHSIVVQPMTDHWKGDGEETEMWGHLKLTDGHYRCPKCSNFELRFGTNAGGHGRIMFD
jgi:ribosomal protein S27AE